MLLGRLIDLPTSSRMHLISSCQVIRTQISFEPEQFDQMQTRARESGISMAALVREAVDEKLARSDAERERIKRRALSVIGTFHGNGEDVSEDHDRYLDEVYGEW